jgi:tetratricopeptide (TPR) repeat protein
LGGTGRAFWNERAGLRAALDAETVERGEALRLAWHPSHVNPAYRLPWATVLEADALLRLGPLALQAATALLWLLALGLTFALGRELGGTAAGAAAAALWAPVFAGLPRGPGTSKQLWLTVLGLLAAVLWVRRQRKSTDASSALAGAGFGLSLLTRGTFVFFPLAVALLERRRRGLLLAGAALAFLLPWTLMNAVSQRRFVPLEDGAMNMNVVTGALGTVFCAHGDYAALMGEEGGGQGFGSPLRWAAKTVLAEPGRYLKGVALRVRRVLELQPFLFLLAGLALLSRRKDPGVRALGALAAYFIAVNCAMSIEDNYFEPLWPLLAALAAAPVALLPEPAPRLGAALARAVLLAALGGSALMSARLFALMGRYAWVSARHGASSDKALDAALGREPDAPWLALGDAPRLLAAGDSARAAAVLEAASALEGLPRRELLLAWARARAGRPESLLNMTLPRRGAPSAYGDAQAEALALYQALALDARGQDARAQAKMRDAAREWAGWQSFVTPGREAAGDALSPRLAAAAAESFLPRVDQILEGQGPEVQDAAYALAGRALGSTRAWRELFERRLARGDAKGAEAALRNFESAAAGREQAREAAFGWERLDRPERAAAAFAAVNARYGEDGRTWSDRGVALYRAGRKAEAEKAFRRALALDPGFEAARVSLDVVLSERATAARARR